MGAGNLQEVPVMKPQFANVFNVSVNDNRSECSLSFYHMYMQHNYTPQPKGLIDMPEKTVGEVASIMLTRDGAHALTPAHPELRPAGGQRMSAAQTPRPGRYRPFKGKEYELLFVATHSETLEPMVVYRALYGERGVWVRPAAMWSEMIERGGQTVRRFTYIGE